MRDYIHVVYLALGHVAALNRLFSLEGCFTVNLGMSDSMLDTVRAFEAASGRAVPYDIVPRRPGDIASCYASADKAKGLLGTAVLTIRIAFRPGCSWLTGRLSEIPGYPHAQCIKTYLND